MTRDFTFEMYEKLLQAGLEAGYDHLTVREYLSRDDLPERFIIHRHDVDRKPGNSLAMARLEAAYDISSTYYFRTIEKTFKPDIIHEIESLGHEIGYHYEDLDRARGDVDAAHESFENHLNKLRTFATIDTICMHGNPLTTHDNRDMWNGPQKFEEYGLLGEAYLSMDFVDVTYFSDTGRTYSDGILKVKDQPVGKRKKNSNINNTIELVKSTIQHDVSKQCILTHPNRWSTNKLEHSFELIKDVTINAGKLIIQFKTSFKRRAPK